MRMLQTIHGRPEDRCQGCTNRYCNKGCLFPDLLLLWLGLIVGYVLLSTTGCVPAEPHETVQPFEQREIESSLAILVDMSGSFSASWSSSAHGLFLGLMDQFFTENVGGEARVVVCQLSGSSDTVLFEGRPEELRSKFRTPADLNAFLTSHAKPASSPVYQSIRKVVDYVSALPGVDENTRLMTVVLSDLVDNSPDGERQAQGRKMLQSLERYQKAGGGLALYFVAPGETSRWRRILDLAGFEPGTFVIESTLVAQPQLPQFD